MNVNFFRIFLVLSWLVPAVVTCHAQQTARQWNSEVTAGWNLGNQFECSAPCQDGESVAIGDPDGADKAETAWGNPTVTKKTIKAVRGRLGGTVIACGDILTKVSLKTPATISNGVYPSWHPTLPLIAYSVNETSQSFHSRDRNKVEVQDGASDLVLYDVEKNSVRIIANDSTELETFPYWHPDGRSLWYVSAKVPAMSPDEMKVYENTNYEDFKYDIYRKPFDPATRTFGRTDTVLRVSGQGKSATLPRPSPDGRYLLFTAGSYGTFHIWHRDADLYLLDIATRAVRPLSEVNSPDVESYHSWSSNGRWIIFSSRRDDGSYTRLYIAYFDKNGKARKPFRLPQATPDYDDNRMKSYNIPEFMARPVSISKKELEDAIQGEMLNAAIEARTAEINEAR